MAKGSIIIVLLLFCVAQAQISLPGLKLSEEPISTAPAYGKGKPKSTQLELTPAETLKLPTQLPSEKPFPQEGPISENEYLVGPGDRFRLIIWGAVNIDEQLTVTPTGEIFIPDCGSVYISGLTLKAAKEKVIGFLSKVYKGMKFDLLLTGMRTFRVNLVGELELPGLYELNPVQRLSDLILLGKPKDIADLEQIMLIKDKDTTTVNIYDYLYKGKKESNPFLKDGMLVVVPRVSQEGSKVYVSSPSLKLGYYPLTNRLSISDFLEEYGGYTRKIDFHNVLLIRGGTKRTIDLTTKDKDLIVENGDTIIFREIMDSVSVAGEVNKPGVYPYYSGLKIMDYIGMAGGTNQFGSYSKVKVVRNGKILLLKEVEFVQSGDVIIVGRSYYTLFRDIMSTTSGVLSIILTAYALGIFH